ncbi:MAG: T9SS type A sorting domain-containing protein [Flavobacteriales bacterium]|nr:T9SS type A sorting domain-containing protein [Flavobacteriales bacterium]
MKALVIFFIVMNLVEASAQNKFFFMGKVKSTNINTKITLHLFEDGRLIQTIMNKKKFQLELKLNSSYELIYSAPGYFSKYLIVDTKVPSLCAHFDFEPFRLNATLFSIENEEQHYLKDNKTGIVKFHESSGKFHFKVIELYKHKKVIQQMDKLKNEPIVEEKEKKPESTVLSPVKIFPNPASTLIFINGTSEIRNYEVFNIKGQSIQNIDASQTHSGFDISSLASGIYFVKSKDLKGNTVGMGRFVKR